jgi:hypothetical protein
MHCVSCGCEMRRRMREGFLERRIYPLFGYYPWECPLCRQLVMYKVRHIRRRRSHSADARTGETSAVKSSSHVPSGISPAKTS